MGKDHIRSNLYCEVRAIHHIPETQLRILNFILSAKERKTMAWSDLFLNLLCVEQARTIEGSLAIN